MRLDATEVLGLVAAVLTTGSFVPQAWKILRDRQTRDISLGMYSMLWVGVVFWVAYGLLSGSVSVLAANSVTLVLAGIILVQKIRLG